MLGAHKKNGRPRATIFLCIPGGDGKPNPAMKPAWINDLGFSENECAPKHAPKNNSLILFTSLQVKPQNLRITAAIIICYRHQL
jgi:hypothetical protein